jgi:hypothetical protein
VLALLDALRRRRLLMLVKRTAQTVAYHATAGLKGRRWTVDAPSAVSIPYGVPIAIGAILAWFFPDLPGAVR